MNCPVMALNVPSQALQCLVSIQRSLVDWYQITTANAALGVLEAAAAADAEADDQHLLEADPKPAAAGVSRASVGTVSDMCITWRSLVGSSGLSCGQIGSG